MRTGLIALAAVALFGSSEASATDWRIITSAEGQQGEKAYFLMDRDSITRQGDHAFGSLYLIAGDLDLMAKVEFDCTAKRYRVITGRLTRGGEVRNSSDEDWQEGHGESHAVLFDYACGFDPAKPDSHESLGKGDPLATIRGRLAKEE